MKKTDRINFIKEQIKQNVAEDEIVKNLVEEASIKEDLAKKEFAEVKQELAAAAKPKTIAFVPAEEAPEGFVFMWHPLKGRRMKNQEHADNLLEAEKTIPSGWKLWSGEPIEVEKEEAEEV